MNGFKDIETAARKAAIRYGIVGSFVCETGLTESIKVACYEYKAIGARVVALDHDTEGMWNDDTDIEGSFKSAAPGMRAFFIIIYLD